MKSNGEDEFTWNIIHQKNKETKILIIEKVRKREEMAVGLLLFMNFVVVVVMNEKREEKEEKEEKEEEKEGGS